MASGTQQHQHQYQQQQQQQNQQTQQELPMPQQYNQAQFTSNRSSSVCLDPQQHIQQMSAMSPIAANPMSVDQNRGLMMSMSPQRQQQQQQQQQHQQQDQMMHQIVGPSVVNNQDMCNQSTTSHHMQQQKSHLLPLLLSPRPSSLKPADQNDQAQQPDIDHDQIIEQVISLENEYSDPSSAMISVDNSVVMMANDPHQQHQLADANLQNCMPENNELSSSSEDLLNLLLEFDRDSSSMMASGVPQLDQDEKVGIETIRKQLMSCEVQSDPLNGSSPNGMSSTFNNQMIGSNQQQQQVRTTQQSQHSQVHHSGLQQQLISQTAPVISHQQPQHQLSTSGVLQQRQQQQQQQQQLPQHHRLSVDQTLLHSSYSNTNLGNAVPVSSSGQAYHQQRQNIARITQSTPMSIDNSSASPSWQQPQLSPYSPQSDSSRPPSQRQHYPTMQHPIQSQHPSTTPTTTSSHQIQQLHHSTPTRSPSQSISPPNVSEPSPVVKKNPLLNAQLVNSRTPSITPSRFIGNQTNVLNQNPILNSKLSQNPFVTSNCVTVGGSPVNPNLNPQPTRFIQRQQQQSPHQQQSNFGYDIPQQQQQQQQQQQNAQQHTPPQPGYMSMYGHGDQQQQTTQLYRASNVTTTANTCSPHGEGPHMIMSSTSPSSGLSQQVKQEIRKKVQQPKQQHQTTSLLKQLLSDDNK